MTAGAPRRLGVRGPLLLALASVILAHGARTYGAALEDARDRLSVEDRLLRRERGLVHAHADLSVIAEEAALAVKLSRAWLLEGEDVLAGGSLLRHLAAEAERAGLRMDVAEPQEPILLNGGLRALPVRVRATGDFVGLLLFLHALQEGRKLVTVEDLVIQRHELAADHPGGTQLLTITALVSGYALEGGEGVAAAP